MRGKSRRGKCVGRGNRAVRREMCKWLDERALGMEAEMVFGENVCRCQSEVPPAPIVAWRNDGAL